MATKFEFYLSDEDTDRLFLMKEKLRKNDMTGNEYAKEILSRELRNMHPSTPEVDETGNYIIK